MSPRTEREPVPGHEHEPGHRSGHDGGPTYAAADSAGVPWAGRSFDSNPHAADDGSAPAELADVLRRFHAGEAGQAAVVDVFGRSRLLIPLLAELGDGDAEVGAHGLAVDKSQELSIVTVEGPDGRRVLPVFSSVAAMSRWNPAARPVPADGVRVALAAADDGTDLIVLDPGSETEFALRRPAVWSVAQSLPWRPPFDSADVHVAFERSIGTELAVLGVSLSPGDPTARLRGPELVVRLTLVAGLTRQELDAVLQRLASRWAADDAIATLVDSLTVRLTGAGD